MGLKPTQAPDTRQAPSCPQPGRPQESAAGCGTSPLIWMFCMWVHNYICVAESKVGTYTFWRALDRLLVPTQVLWPL